LHVLVHVPGTVGGGLGDAGGFGVGVHEGFSAKVAALEYAIKLTVRSGVLSNPVNVFDVAMHSRYCSTMSTDQLGCSDMICATMPATCGHAIDVPDMVPMAVEDSAMAAVIDEPGAAMSTHGPQLEKPDRESRDVIDATVIARGSDAGDLVHASEFSWPAATTTGTQA
jgi:hypothetical protein